MRRILYVALALRREGGPVGFVRVSLPLSDLEEKLMATRRTVIAGCAVALGMIVAAAISG